MGKHIGIRIITCLCPVFTYIGLGQNLAVRRKDPAPNHPVRERILSGIIGTVDKIVTFEAVKISQIPNQADKDNSKKHGNKSVFFISRFTLLSNLFLPLLLQLFVSLSLPLLYDVFQFLRPRPLYKYTSPG